MRLVVFGIVLVIGGCAGGWRWERVDGGRPGEWEFSRAETVCRGEVARARMVGDFKLEVTDRGLEPATSGIFRGCMAERGWMVR